MKQTMIYFLLTDKETNGSILPQRYLSVRYNTPFNKKREKDSYNPENIQYSSLNIAHTCVKAS